MFQSKWWVHGGYSFYICRLEIFHDKKGKKIRRELNQFYCPYSILLFSWDITLASRHMALLLTPGVPKLNAHPTLLHLYPSHWVPLGSLPEQFQLQLALITVCPRPSIPLTTLHLIIASSSSPPTISFIKHLLCPKYGAKHFMSVCCLTLRLTIYKWILLSRYYFKWAHWGSERWENFFRSHM